MYIKKKKKKNSVPCKPGLHRINLKMTVPLFKELKKSPSLCHYVCGPSAERGLATRSLYTTVSRFE